MGWDGMGWDGMGWDGMGWDGMGWDSTTVATDLSIGSVSFRSTAPSVEATPGRSWLIEWSQRTSHDMQQDGAAEGS
jgi:hypothetical protein